MSLLRVAALACVLSCSLVLKGEGETDAQRKSEEDLRAEAKKTFEEKVEPFVKQYCTRCHGGGRAKANVNLEVDLKAPGRGVAFVHWKKAVANVKVHDMPPEDAAKQPSDEERQQFIEWIDQLKYLSPVNPGPFVIRRLSTTEYGNTLHDLYGVDPSIADPRPEEVLGEGYLNSISPMQSELFLDLANRVVEQVVAPEGKERQPFRGACLAKSPVRKKLIKRRLGRLPATWPGMRIDALPPRRSWTFSWMCLAWLKPKVWITRHRLP